MKKIGILGGLAWPATIEYYRAICKMSQKYHSQFNINGPSPVPEMCIESVNINYSYNRRGMIGDDASWSEYDSYFNAALKRLEESGVDFAIITANTLHTRFDSITRNINIPIISIFDAIAAECKKKNISNFLFLGTGPTMESASLPEFMKEKNITAFPPPSKEKQNRVINLISSLFEEKIENGRRILNNIIESSYNNIDVKQKTVCLACTELPLVYEGKEDFLTFYENDILFLNSAFIHAKAAFEYAIERN